MNKVYIVNKRFLITIGLIVLFALVVFSISDRSHHDKIYDSCAQVHKAGKANLAKGHEGYSLALDRNHNGIACEEK